MAEVWGCGLSILSPRIIRPLCSWYVAVGQRITHPASECALFGGETLADRGGHPVVSGIMVIPHRAGPVEVDVVVLQGCSPALGGFSRPGVGQGFGKEHDVAGIAGYFDRPWSVETALPPSFPVEGEIFLVRTRDHGETAIARVIGREHGYYVEHR